MRDGKLHVAVVLLATVIGGAVISAIAWNVLDSSKLRVGYVRNDVSRLPLVHATAAGYFREVGLDVKVAEFSSEADLLRAMREGQLDVGLVGIPALVTHEIAFPSGIKILAGSNYNGTSLVVHKDGGVNGMDDLANTTVAIPAANGTGALLARALLNGTAAWGSVNLTVADPAGMAQALNASTIDAMVAWELYASIATHKEEYGSKGYHGKRLHASADAWGNRTTTVLAIRGELLAGDDWTPVIARFLAVHARAVADMPLESQRDAMLDILKRNFFMNRVDAIMVLDTVRFTTSVTPGDVEAFIDELVAFSMVPVVPDVPGLAATLLA